MIRLDHVTKVYPRSSRPALDDVSVDIDRGEFVFLVGASGSGKSTMLRLIIREEEATRGTVLVAGQELGTMPRRRVPALRRRIGTVFQDFRLLPRKTVHDNVAFALEVLGTRRSEIRRRVPQTLDMVGLAGMERRLPHELSGGEQQRVAIARALVNDPTILIADEPTGNLDPAISLEIISLLDRVNARGTTVLLATHDDEIVNTMRRRVLELASGHLVRDEPHGLYRIGRSPDLLAQVAAGDGILPADAGGDAPTAVLPRGDRPHHEPGGLRPADPATERIVVPEPRPERHDAVHSRPDRADLDEGAPPSHRLPHDRPGEPAGHPVPAEAEEEAPHGSTRYEPAEERDPFEPRYDVPFEARFDEPWEGEQR